MKRFLFPLDRVLDWRAEQLRLEEMRLETLYAELRALVAKQQEVEAEKMSSERELLALTVVDGQQLEALDRFRRHSAAAAERLKIQQSECAKRIEAQRRRVLEVQRQFRLLERLREKKRSQWQFDFNKELEDQASETFLAKWVRERE